MISADFAGVGKVTYCVDHFTCDSCNRTLADTSFISEGSENFHVDCFYSTRAASCAKCNKPIKEQEMNALDKSWHPDCFACGHCKVPFGAGASFVEKDGQAYCVRDYMSLFAKRCGKCSGAIEDTTSIEAQGISYHEKCFVCAKCGVSVVTGYAEVNGELLCGQHANAGGGGNTSTKSPGNCKGCQQPVVSGSYYTAGNHNYHVDCFGCTLCARSLADGKYVDKDGLPYCVSCSQ